LNAVAGCQLNGPTLIQNATLLNTTVAIDENAIITAGGGTSPYRTVIIYQTSNVFPSSWKLHFGKKILEVV
jgi:hypothetical protein